MKRCLALGCLVLSLPLKVWAQAAAPTPMPLNARSTLVLVPALVRSRSGEPVFGLSAEDFSLTDDGVPERLRLEEDAGGEPLSLVIDLEVGGAGTREFEKLGALTPMLESLVGEVPHRIAVVGFDSEPALVQPFTGSIGTAARRVLSLTPGCSRQNHDDDCKGPNPVHDLSLGDNGAAILDSLGFSVDLLRREPAGYRRAILLISETLDRGSRMSLEDAARAISESNTSIYSIGFSTVKSEAAHYAHRVLPTGPGTAAQAAEESKTMPAGGFTLFDLANHIPNPPTGCMGRIPNAALTEDMDQNLGRMSRLYDCAGQLMPPLLFARMATIAATDGLKRNVPETVARVTGGEYFRLTDAKSLERSLAAISNHLPNRYMLSFQPTAPHPGMHTLSLRLRDRPELNVAARKSWWSDPGDGYDKNRRLP